MFEGKQNFNIDTTVNTSLKAKIVYLDSVKQGKQNNEKDPGDLY